MTPTSQLAYVSRRHPDLTTDQVVDELVLPAMRKNRRLDVTGCLWFGKTHFLQIIEGPPDTIDALYKTIERDNRHHDIRLINVTRVESRDFPRFALKHIPGNEIVEINRLIDRFSPETCAVNDRIRANALGPRPLDDESASLLETVIARLRAAVS